MDEKILANQELDVYQVGRRILSEGYVNDSTLKEIIRKVASSSVENLGVDAEEYFREVKIEVISKYGEKIDLSEGSLNLKESFEIFEREMNKIFNSRTKFTKGQIVEQIPVDLPPESVDSMLEEDMFGNSLSNKIKAKAIEDILSSRIIDRKVISSAMMYALTKGSFGGPPSNEGQEVDSAAIVKSEILESSKAISPGPLIELFRSEEVENLRLEDLK